MNMALRYIWMNGELVGAERATVPFLSAGLHYGVSVFEGIRCYATDAGPAIFRLQEYVDRLIASAHVLGFRDLPCDAPQLIEAIKLTVRANELADAYIRPVMYLAVGGWNLSVDDGHLHVGVAAWPWQDLFGPDGRELGLRAHVSSFTRHHANAAMTKAKVAGNYVNSILARTESLRLGFDEAIMLDPDGHVAECTTANVFVVRRNTISTPPAARVLEGVTRDTVLTLAHGRGMPVEERPITRDALYTADEVFLCGTSAEIAAIREIDHRTIGKGRTGPVTRHLQGEYRAVTRGGHPLSAAWLTQLDEEPGTDRAWLPPTADRHEPMEVGYGHGV